MVKVRKVVMSKNHLGTMEKEMQKWLPYETNGYGFGKLYDNGVAHITHVCDGGPKTERASIRCSGDEEYATSVKEELRKQDPDIGLLGEFHVHPWNGEPMLSNGDIKQLMDLKKARHWQFSMLMTKDGFQIWDVIDGCAHKIPCQIVNSNISKEGVLDRILKVTQNDVLTGKTVLIVGLGSGGSAISKYLGCSGIGKFILVDNEDLEAVNVIRHEGGLDDIGKPKTEICKRLIESHNPFAVVECHRFDTTNEIERLEGLAAQADLIIGSSGSAKVNHIINKISLERGIPAVYGGVYERATGGFVLAVLPNETACFNCLFKMASEAYSVDKEAANRYGLSEDELHQQQGLWINITFPSLILCNAALDILLSKKLKHNLFLYDSSMEIRKLMIIKSEECAVCNKETWIKSVSETGTSEKSVRLSSIRQKLRVILKRKGESHEH